MSEIEIRESVFAQNETAAARTNARLTERGVFCVNVIGAPGAGKTTLLLNVIPKLPKPSFVIEGDIASDIDTQRLNDSHIASFQINTGGACHLEAPTIDAALNHMPDGTGFVFIENIGNLVCPAEFLIGEHVKLIVCDAAEGADKPYKYPLAFEKADLVVVSKADLFPYIDFDLKYFTEGVRKLNELAPIVVVSAKTGQGYQNVVEWITAKGF